MYPSLGKQDVAEEAETQFEDELVSEGVTEATDMEEDAGGCGFEQEGFVARQGEGFQEADFDEKGLEQDLSLAGVTGASGVGGEVRGCGFEQDPGFEELQGGQGLDCEGPEEERLSEGGTEASELRLDGGFQQDQGFEELQGVPGLDCEGPYDEVGFSEVNEEVWEGDEEEPREGLGVEGMEEDSERRGENKAEEGEIKVEQRENKAGEGFEKAEIRERKVEERREKTGGGGCQADEWEKKADVAVGGENFETDAAEPRTGIGGASGPVCEEASGRFFETEWGGGSEGQKEGNDHPGSRSSDWFGSSVTGRGGRTGQDEANPHAGRRGAESPNERAVTDSGTAFEDSDTWHDDLDTWQEGGECWEELPADRLLPTDGTACEAELRTRETSGEAEESLPGETGAARDSGSVPREPDYEGVEDCDAGADFPADENGALSTRVGQSGGREAELERESVHGDLDPATQFGRGDDCKAGAGPCGEPSGEGGQSVGLLESSECPPRTNVVSADCTVQSCEISVDILTIDSREQAYILRSIEQAKLKSDKAPRGKRKVTAPPGSRVATRSGSGVKGKRSKLVSPSVAASESASVRRTKSEGQAQGQTLIKSFFSI